MKHASSFASRFRSIEEQFRTNKYGPEWTFARWLIAKCGMSLRTCYRVIQQLERTANDEDRRRTGDALAEIRKQEAQEKADRRARQLAWNGWLLDEKMRRAATQAAWDEWKEQDKQRIVAEKDAEKQAKAAERKKAASRERSRRYRRDVKAKKERENNVIGRVTLSEEENDKRLPTVATVDLEMVLAELVALISAIPKSDRLPAIRQVVGVLHGLCDDIEDHGEAAGWISGGIDIRH